MPRETLDYLMNLEIPVQFIQGNGDREILAQMRGIETNAIPERFRESTRWVAKQLQPKHQVLLASWPMTLSLEVTGLGKVLFCHATPRNDTEIFTRLTSEDRLLPLFEGLDVSLVVCGHTHMPFDRTIGKVRVVNAGSVGMPYGEPGASWLLLGPDDVHLQRTTYDLTKAAERIRGTNYPLAQEFAVQNILQTPSEREALEVFGKNELK
jgi:predicted phosphodiesterase